MIQCGTSWTSSLDSGRNNDFLRQDCFASLLNSKQACRMTDLDNNKEKHTVCTDKILRKGFMSGLEWDSWGHNPHPRELSVPGTLWKSLLKLTGVHHAKIFACNSTRVSILGITVPPTPPEPSAVS